MNLYQIETPKDVPRPFSAGLVIDAKGDVWEAAPIIRWMKGKPLSFIISYCKNKNWKLNACPS